MKILTKKGELYFHLDSNIASVFKKTTHVWTYDSNGDHKMKENSCQSKRDCLHPQEYMALKSHIAEIEKAVPEPEGFVPCEMRDGHINQLGMLILNQLIFVIKRYCSKLNYFCVEFI